MIAYQRLRKEYITLLQDPPPNAIAHPDPKNRLKWHYMIHSLENTPYEGGYYYGQIVFPVEYPYKPPSIQMKTPSGRFVPGQRLCFSMSDFHPQTWDPLWSISTILTALATFMISEQYTVGSMKSTNYQKSVLAQKSESFNMKDQLFVDLFGANIQSLKNKKNLGQSKQLVQKKADEQFKQIQKNQSENQIKWPKVLLFFGSIPLVLFFSYKLATYAAGLTSQWK